MAFEPERLAATIMSEVNAASPAGTAKASNIAGFCELWPKARPVLEFIAGIATFIPGLGQQAAAILKGLLKIGDQIAASVCKT